jgi:hypothetical protein
MFNKKSIRKIHNLIVVVLFVSLSLYALVPEGILLSPGGGGASAELGRLLLVGFILVLFIILAITTVILYLFSDPDFN